MKTLLAMVLVLAAASGSPSLPDIEDEVMCPTCGTALNIAGGPAANQQRELIRELIAQGLTKDEIKQELVAEYGEEVLATPDSKGFDLLVWLIPGILVGGGIGGIVVMSRRWRSNRSPEPAVAGPGLSEDEDRRLDAELASLER